MYHRVQKLFHGHADLLEEFHYFLPDNQNAGKQQQQQRKQPKPKPARPAPQQQQQQAVYAKPRKEKPQLEQQKRAITPMHGQGQPQIKVGDKGRVRTVVFPAGSEKETQLFDRLKTVLPRENWTL